MTAEPEERTYDVAVIGAGVVGCAVARELAGYDLRVALVEAKADVGDATSKANTAILHTGFDATPGTLESRLVRARLRPARRVRRGGGHPARAHRGDPRRLDRGGVRAAPGLLAKAEANGYHRCELLDAAERRGGAPRTLAPARSAACIVPDESIICPWTTTLAFATEALARGADLLLRHEVRGATAVGRRHGARHLRRRGPRPAGSSTPPDSAPTCSTGCSAATRSPSPRAAAS